MSDDSIEIYTGDPSGIADFIGASMQEKENRARTPILERAGNPYCPSSGTEGMAFEEAFCGTCKHYKHIKKLDAEDCSKGILTQAWVTADVNDPAFPKEWVYDANGAPSCSAYARK